MAYHVFSPLNRKILFHVSPTITGSHNQSVFRYSVTKPAPMLIRRPLSVNWDSRSLSGSNGWLEQNGANPFLVFLRLCLGQQYLPGSSLGQQRAPRRFPSKMAFPTIKKCLLIDPDIVPGISPLWIGINRIVVIGMTANLYSRINVGTS